MLLWNNTKCIKPKDLRNTLQTEAIDGDWYGFYVQRYVGHPPKTIGERIYYGDQHQRMVEMYRDRVVYKIEELIGQWKSPIDSPLINIIKEKNNIIARPLHDRQKTKVE